jgi:hypothetical protein
VRITPGILQERNGLDPFVRFRVQGERQIEPSAPQAAHDGLDLLDLAQDDLDIGMGLSERPERGRHQLGGSRLGHPDADACPLTAAGGVDVGAHGLHLAEGTTSPPVGGRAGGGELHGTAAAGPGEQLRAEHSLQRGDLVRDRRLGVPELRGGTAERAEVGNRDERPQLAEADPFINRPDRSLYHQLFRLSAKNVVVK